MSDQHLQAARRLADVLAEENDALKRLDFVAAVALVPAKEAALAEMTRPPMPGIQRSALGQRLGRLAAENQALLERAIEVQTRIVRIIARAAAPQPALIRYNGHGSWVHGSRAHGSRTQAGRAAALAVSTRA
jgi:hypothetical protein